MNFQFQFNKPKNTNDDKRIVGKYNLNSNGIITDHKNTSKKKKKKTQWAKCKKCVHPVDTI